MGIEPTIGHLKSDFRLGRNFIKVCSGMLSICLSRSSVQLQKRAMRVPLATLLKHRRHSVFLQYPSTDG